MSGSYVALLRGINVGGRNPIRMPELAECFRDAGYEDVGTYLQSGNVLFQPGGRGRPGGQKLEADVEAMLEQRFGMPLLVVIRSRDELARTIEAAPADHGSPKLRSDVFFLKHPLTAEAALAEMPELREGVDAVAAGPGAIYFSRVAARATKTRIQKFMAMPVFQQMTVRTWGTCTKLLEKLDEMDGAA
ncbi:uncharacterized protein (DUF1697 family) [Agromyces sp. 3263]|uniref:DUF1697 domain-containing protein n=1 Tax=Agromyces sp. 3263 TaxID=2817750 RepID=UPI00285F1927|nr:DUF1697 domain-containing protein [Agromyces sp. 3263]MDR6906375.1 uncharacterized protein (DUF1697 family) [Agromyces sp. 3263]